MSILHSHYFACIHALAYTIMHPQPNLQATFSLLEVTQSLWALMQLRLLLRHQTKQGQCCWKGKTKEMPESVQYKDAGTLQAASAIYKHRTTYVTLIRHFSTRYGDGSYSHIWIFWCQTR